MQVAGMEVLVVRKPIKNLHLSVLPPLGRVRVSAPLAMKDDAIRAFLATKIAWIKKQKAKFKSQERQTRREYVSGETHYYLGKPYRLEVIFENKPPQVHLSGKNKMVLRVRPNSGLAKREEVMLRWYRGQLRTMLNELLPKWQKRLGVHVGNWGIRRMKTRWGTCNQKAKRILLNLELVKKPVACIEYVAVHELLHLIEKKHNENFVNLMIKYLPKWRSVRDELNRFILSHEEWSY